MKTTVLTTELLKGIKVLDKVKNGTSLSILDYIKVTNNGSFTEILKSNIQTNVKIKLESYDNESGEILFPSVKLIKKIKENYITFTNNEILTDKKKISFKNFDINDYAKEPLFMPENKIFTTNENELHKMLEVKYAVAQDNIRPMLTGVNFNKSETCALDGFRLSIRKGNYDNKENFIVPIETIKILDSIISKKNQIVNVYLIKDYVKFEIGNIEVISKLMEGEYIKYNQLIPKECNFNMLINDTDMIEELDFITSNGNKFLKLEFEENNIKMIANDEDNKIQCNVSCEYKVHPTIGEIGVNPKYLIEAIKNCGYNTIDFKVNTKVSPMILTNNDDKIELVLPVRIAS